MIGSPSRAGRRDARAIISCPTSMSLLVAVFSVLVMLQIVSNTDQAAMPTVGVVRVVRVDVPPVVRSYDAKLDAGVAEPAPLLLGCTYALEGGENDDENGDTMTTTTATTSTATMMSTTSAWTPTANATDGDAGRGQRSASDVAMDAAMEEVQHQRGLVVKWYFRRDPIPAASPGDPMAIDDSVQVYQWLAGGGPEAGGGLGPLSGRVVDVTAETPRANKSLLHRVIRVERPTAELTGQYRCQVEDWHAERRSAWHPMVVYTPERIFKISVDDNDDDDEHDITEGSGGEVNSTTQVPSTTSSGSGDLPSSTGSKQWPTEINITCYAAGVHPEPSMSIWVNGVMQDSVNMMVTDDDGDDDETNDDDNMTSTTAATTTTTTTTTSPVKSKVRSRFRGGIRGGEEVVYKNYAVRASKVVSLKEVEEHRTGVYKQPRRRNAVEVECRLRVPGDDHWKSDRSGDHYYSARRSVAYKYRGDSSDAYAAVSSASSMDDDDDDNDDNVAARESANGVGPSARPAAGALFVVLQSVLVAGVAVLAVDRQ